jgi:hypothetical protein
MLLAFSSGPGDTRGTRCPVTILVTTVFGKIPSLPLNGHVFSALLTVDPFDLFS